MLLKILNKATSLYTFQKVISLYVQDVSAFYVIYYTQTIAVINKPMEQLEPTANPLARGRSGSFGTAQCIH